MRNGERLSFRESAGEYVVQEAVLVRPEVAQRELEQRVRLPQPEVPEKAVRGEAAFAGEGTRPLETTVPSVGVKHLRLRVRIPWDKMSDFMCGVLMPLQRDGAELSIEMDLKATSSKGISKSTLEQTVRETLRQVGAEVLEEQQV